MNINILFYMILFLIYISFFIINIKIFFKNVEIKNIKDKKLNDLFILGTHDSLSYNINNYFSQFAKTQLLNLELQLKYNVRFFDLRFKVKNDKLIGYHSFINLNINHEEIFNIFLTFLNNNKDEFLIIMLRNENFTNHNIIIQFLEKNYIIPNNLEKYFIYNNDNWTYNPTIIELKNKIFIINVNKNKDILPWADDRNFNIGNMIISDKYSANVLEKIEIYDKFIENIDKDKINIFYASIAFNDFIGIKYNAKKIYKLIKEKLLKNNIIFIADFIEYYI